MTKDEIESAADHSYENRYEIEQSKMCGCYYCMRTFPASLITYRDYTDFGKTARCPFCEIDAVIGDASGVPINEEVLTEIYDVEFSIVTSSDNYDALNFFDDDEQQ